MVEEPDISWKEFGACKGKPAKWWFPSNNIERQKGIEICNTCEVQEPCREYGWKYEAFGTWGGVPEYKRRRVRKSRRDAA